MKLLVLLTSAASALVLTSNQKHKLLEVDGDTIPGDYIVKLSSESKRSVSSFASEFNATQVWEALPTFKGFAASLSDEQIELLLGSSDVTFIEPDMVVYALGPQDECPDSQNASMSWGQARTTAESIYDGLTTFYHDSFWGEGVDIVVVDTGTNCDHEEFSGGECECGPSFFGGDGCSDGNGHGTHCSSTAGGERYGVAKSAKLVGVKVLADDNLGTASTVISGINYVAERAQATGRKTVASLSLGGSVCHSMNAAVDAAVEVGCAMVVAAGNEADDACLISPASAETAVTVGSTDIYDRLSWFTNIGTCVDIFAPGSDITAAWSGGNSAYNTISGTSMATPHVAGAVAALLSLDPSVTASNVKERLSELSIKNAITNLDTDGSPNELLHLDCVNVGTRSPTATPKCSVFGSTDVQGADPMLELEGTNTDECCNACEITDGCAAFVFTARLVSERMYEKATSGTCESHTEGRCSTITDIDFCLEAGVALYDGISAGANNDNKYPYGCYNCNDMRKLYKNVATNSSTDCSDYECACLCPPPTTPTSCRLYSSGDWTIVDAESHVTHGVLIK